MSSSFIIRLHNLFLDGHRNTAVLQDYDDTSGRIDIDALVASGDYFATLITTLDQVSSALKHTQSEPEYNTLEHAINTLLYIERNYKIVKK